MPRRLASFALAAVVALARGAGAQVLTGTVHDSVSRLPVPGVVVMLLDSAGGTVARTLSNERGEFHVVRRDTARTARFVRIGFQPREVPLPSLAEPVPRLDISMFALPALIHPVRVVENSRCKPRKDRADALGLWQQAQAGLLATIVGREAKPAKMLRLVFDQQMNGNTDQIEAMRVRLDSADTSAVSFVAAHPAQDLVRFGFSTDSLASGVYFGPDAEVLLSDYFAGAYCFELASGGRARPAQVGLRFLPADHRRGRVDIDGTLWIDTVARELRDVEYRYLNVERGAAPFHPGGYVSFRSMSNGVVLIDHWWIRVVSATADTLLSARGQSIVRDWNYAEEDGGELARALWPDGTAWHASLGALRLHVVTKDGQPAAGAVVALLASDYFGTSDARGMLEIKELLPGPYAARVIDPRIAALGIGLPTPLRFRAAPDSTIVATLVLPTIESSIADRCVANHVWNVADSVFTIGRVVSAGGKPMRNAKVTFATWSRADGGHWAWNPVYFTTSTDGMFEFCHDVRPDAEVLFRVTRDGVVQAEFSRKFTSDLLVVPVVVVPPAPE